jgi:Flp pilus assembly protein TadD
VPAVDRVAKIDRLPLLPPPRPDPFAPPPGLPRDVADPDPVKEAMRLMKLGRDAFAAGEYGRAGERFDRAAVANPKVAEPHFLKAQALLAAGSYAEAVAAVRAGLALDPAWPASLFDLKEPYGAGAARFAEHLAELRKVTAANPDEPTLQFLLGYQLWFVGEKAEAKKWFAAAEKRLAAPEVIGLFK